MTHREIIDIFKLRIGALMALTAVAGYVVAFARVAAFVTGPFSPG